MDVRCIHSFRKECCNMAMKLPCDLCLDIFTSKRGMSNHRLVHGREKKKHKCEQCDKSFVRPDVLRIHQNIHSGAKQYNCAVCRKSFNQAANLATHQLIHKGEKMHKCEECKKTFLVAHTLKLHLLTQCTIG